MPRRPRCRTSSFACAVAVFLSLPPCCCAHCCASSSMCLPFPSKSARIRLPLAARFALPLVQCCSVCVSVAFFAAAVDEVW
ncbi:hypothetical protein B0T16DRAFT_69313 [Cercophora newfieldiana]|uniref:Secreted protein n=1 Tax=Cercophora newfieldiana TaxID=92897 RepID=A0AA39YUR6_9PEZI|nr:hypothetical protein B0T16DRAFT_69313 [Cercophora newfieldiana]